eukprot:3564753-Pleurochrysis_carterae.AAC.1
MEAPVVATMTVAQVLAQCGPPRSPVARVVLRNIRPNNPCPDVECKYGRRRSRSLCQDGVSASTPLVILAEV